MPPYRSKFRRKKMPKMWLAAKKNLVFLKFCSPQYKKETHKILTGRQNCLNFELVSKTLSAEDLARLAKIAEIHEGF